MGVYIPNMSKPKDCRKCPRKAKYDDGWSIREKCLELNKELDYKYDDRIVMQDDCPLIEIGDIEYQAYKEIMTMLLTKIEDRILYGEGRADGDI